MKRFPLGPLKFLPWMALFLFPFYSASGQTACSLNFEQSSGPSATPFTSQPVQYGLATVSGGALATAAKFDIHDGSTIYLTFMSDSDTTMYADVGTNGPGYPRVCTDCSETLTISFSEPVSNFGFTLYTGLANENSTYMVTVNGNTTLTQLDGSLDYEPNCGSPGNDTCAFVTYPFPPYYVDGGSGIQPTSNVSLVTIAYDLGALGAWYYNDGAWDFFIDNITYTRPDNLPCNYTPPPPDPGPCNECEAMAGQPINLSTGDVWLRKTEYSVPGLSGGLSLTRTWNSLWNLNNPPFIAGMFGTGWTSDFEERLQVLSSGQIEYWRSTGNTWSFVQPAGCPTCAYTLAAPPNQHASLAYNSSTALYTLTFADSTTKTFNSSGYLTAVTDRNSNQTTFTYDSSNRVAQVTAASGQSLTFTYGLAGDSNRVTSIQDSVGTVATYSYSSSLLTQAAYPDGGQFNYAYDANDNITSVTDSQAKTIETHTYDSSGRGLTSARAGGVDAVTVQYSTGSTLLTDSMGNATTYTYTSIGGSNFITGIQGPGCDSCGGRNNQTFTLDSSGNRLSATDPNGNTVSYTFDSSGDVLTRTDSAGTWTYTYNGFGEVLTAKDPLSNTTTNTYDAKGNLLTTTTPTASQTKFTYDTKGDLLTITDPNGHATTLAYFTTGLINTIKDAQRNVSTFAYDARGNRTSVKDALGNTTAFAYDSMNRLTKITYPNSTTTQLGYDTRGRRTSVMDANIKTTIYAYDDADRLISVMDPPTNLTQYSYDTENNLTSIADALHRVTTFSYDHLDRLTETLFPSNLFETYAYDNNGNLTGKTDRNGKTISYTYDQLNRLTQKFYPDSTSVMYTYDTDSRLTQVTDPTGSYQFAYDNTGRLTGTTTSYAFLVSRSFTTHYAYDAASNRTSFTDPESGVTSYAYDTLNRLSTLTPPSAISTGSFGLSYDALSRRTQLTRPNKVTTSYSYDSLSRLLSVTHVSGRTTLDGASYAVDAAGNRTSRTPLPGGAATNFAYDALYELLTATQGSTTNENYSYDAVGNRLSSLSVPSYSYNSSNELTSSGPANYTYDNNGNELTKADSTGTTSYTWDFESHLTSVTLPGSGGTVSFKYDPFGRRIEKSSSTTTSIYAYDQDNLIEETNASGSVVARYTQMDVDEPLAMLRSGTTSYYHADALNSITSLSNAAGALANTYTYDSFGNIKNSTGSIVNPFRYAARDFDTETNLHYFRTRYLDPSTGRFLSEDTARFDESVNFYPYVNNNPMTFNDPFGQGIVDCAVELAKLAALEAKLGARLAEQAAASCKDAGHQKAIDQLRNAVDKQAAKVARHCSDADTKKQLLLLGVLAVAIATAPETGGGSLGWAWAWAF